MEISFSSENYGSTLIFAIDIDGEKITGSPYNIDLINYLDGKYNKYIKSNENGPDFFDYTLFPINRKLFFESLVASFPKKSKSRSQTVIHYEGEVGIDASGLTRDFFECLGEYAQNPVFNLFQKIGDHYRIHPNSNPKLMKVYGRALANGIIHRQKVPISLCDSLIKILLEAQLSNKDLEKEQPSFSSNLVEIMSYSEEELASMYINFTVNKDKYVVKLIENGDSTFVNIENRQKYFDLRLIWELRGYAEDSISKFVKGFFQVAKPLAKLFNVDEFRFIMCGMDSSYIEILKNKIECTSNMERQKQWLIRWFGERGTDAVKKFLKFATGSSLIPVGKSEWKIKLRPQLASCIDNLPISHTCFNAVEFPNYANYEILSAKLDYLNSLNFDGFQFA